VEDGSDGLCVLFGCFVVDFLVGVEGGIIEEVSLVPNYCQQYVLGCVVEDVICPFFHALKREVIGNVIHQDCYASIFIVYLGNCAILLLPSSVPNLKPKGPSGWMLKDFFYEAGSKRGWGSGIVLIIDKALADAGLADSRHAHDDHLYLGEFHDAAVASHRAHRLLATVFHR
jgi:hypothetical protein